MKKLLQNNKGFTLVELIVVIAVLGILAGIAVPRLTGVQDKARYAAGEALLANLKTPLELYRVETGSYPDIDGSGNAAYTDLESELTGEDGYLDNFSGILPDTSDDDWSFVSYTLEDDGSYTLEITHPNTDQNLEMTPDGIEKVSASG